ncbi:MAG: diaminopimelate decarboxylase [Gammaproteobacteria bacterium]|nr:MAG: diaminopimelate decarboxylase [Gammaproteobacteria bacterium]
MAAFHYTNSQLHMENTAIADIAKNIHTPFYCYSQSTIETAYQNYTSQLKQVEHLVCFAVKANSNQAIIKVLADIGAGADVVSEGEMRRVLKADVPANKIVYSGIAKTKSEMRFALDQGIFQFNLESENELERLSAVASSMDKTANIAFRINPDVDAETHAKISTGKSENKFGIPISRAREIYKHAATLPNIRIQGVDVHIGSQLTSLNPFKNAFKLIHELVVDLRSDGHDINVIDLGGGLGVNYQKDEMANARVIDYCQFIQTLFEDLNCKIVLEPGRSLVAEAGLLISEVVYKKKGEERTFLIIDSAMNDLLRPSMYDAYHDIISVKQDSEDTEIVDIVGPVCETGDTFAQNRELAKLEEGDLLAICSAGAYGAAMSSTYNTRLLIPEVLVKDDQFSVIKARRSYDELIGMDNLAAWQD